MKITNFRGDLTDNSAKKEALAKWFRRLLARLAFAYGCYGVMTHLDVWMRQRDRLASAYGVKDSPRHMDATV